MSQSFLDGRVILYPGDCLASVRALADCSIDACVTDPPYALISSSKRFANSPRSEATELSAAGPYQRTGPGFMGKRWDTGETAFAVKFWTEVWRVLKPGAHVVAFGGTRSYHRLACAIEDAGFEIRDQLAWAYATGFPKSHDVSKGIDKAAGAVREVVGVNEDWLRRKPNGSAGVNSVGLSKDTDANIYAPATDEARDWEGWGTALKPSYEPLCLAQKPYAFWDEYAIIGSQIESLELWLWSIAPASAAALLSALSRLGLRADMSNFAQLNAEAQSNTQAALSGQMDMSLFESATISSLSTVLSWSAIWAEASKPENTSITETELSTTINLRTLKSLLLKITPENIILDHKAGWLSASASHAVSIFNASVLKLRSTLALSALAPVISQEALASLDAGVRPNWSPICLARKPLSEKTVAANVLRWGTGALNIDATRVGSATRSRSTGEKISENLSMAGGNYAREIVGEVEGRWPANIVHDGSEEVLAAFPDSDGQNGVVDGQTSAREVYGEYGARPRHEPRNDSGSAARFFASFPQHNEPRCGLCRLLSTPLPATSQSCDATVAEPSSPTRNTPSADSVRCDVAGSRQPESGDSPSPLSNLAPNAGSRLNAILPPKDAIARENAPLPPLSEIAQNVKSAADLCGSCATAIAQRLAATRLGHDPASHPLPDFISERSAQILTQNLALYVASRENTDTILTIPNLKAFFGSVFHAIALNTESDASPKDAPTRFGKRFHYDSKADADDRLGSRHPTVKPVDLMQWLCRLVTPPARLVCERCDKLAYAKSAQTTSADSALRPLRQGVQAERQQAPESVLQQAVRERGDDAASENLRDLQETFSTQEFGPALLRQAVRVPLDGEVQEEPKAIPDDETRVSADLQAGASAVEGAGWIHFRTPLGGGAEDRTPTGAGRSCSPPEWDQGGQRGREHSIDEEGRSRQTQSAASKQADVSALPRANRDEPTCPHCGSALTKRYSQILDPFAGTGTTGEAAWREGFSAVLMEREAEYLADIARRMALANEGPMTRAHASTKARGKAEDHGPLFAGEAAVPLPQPVQEAMKI